MLEEILFGGLRQEMQEIFMMKEPRGLTHMIATILQMEDVLFCNAMVNLRFET